MLLVFSILDWSKPLEKFLRLLLFCIPCNVALAVPKPYIVPFGDYLTNDIFDMMDAHDSARLNPHVTSAATALRSLLKTAQAKGDYQDLKEDMEKWLHLYVTTPPLFVRKFVPGETSKELFKTSRFEEFLMLPGWAIDIKPVVQNRQNGDYEIYYQEVLDLWPEGLPKIYVQIYLTDSIKTFGSILFEVGEKKFIELNRYDQANDWFQNVPEGEYRAGTEIDLEKYIPNSKWEMPVFPSEFSLNLEKITVDSMVGNGMHLESALYPIKSRFDKFLLRSLEISAGFL